MKNKYLKLVLGSVLLASLLYTGCGSSDNSKQDEVSTLQPHKVVSRVKLQKVNGTDVWYKDVSISATYDKRDKDDHKFALTVTFNKGVPSNIEHFQIYLNTDNDNNTGWTYDKNDILNTTGADYMIEDGVLFKCKSKRNWKWERMADINYKTSTDGSKFKIEILDGSSEFMSTTDIECVKDIYISVEPMDKNWNDTSSFVETRGTFINVASNDDKIPFGDGSFSTFERVAIFPTVKGKDGKTDYNATYAKVKEMALTFAKYVAKNNEPEVDKTFKGDDWIVSGVENVNDDAEIVHNILQIPTSGLINPNFPASPTNTKKAQVVELRNIAYPGRLLDIKVNGEVLPKSVGRSTAFPFEVAVLNDDKAIYIDIINPEAIFGLFFADVFESDHYKNSKEFRDELNSLPIQTKNEIIAMIYKALNVTDNKTSIEMGPIFSSMTKLKESLAELAPNQDNFYQSENVQTSESAKEIAQKIVEVMTIHGSANAGKQEKALYDTLPSVKQKINPKWVSARKKPLKEIKNAWIIEACSPVYAKQALSVGEHHATALPCEISVYVDPNDSKRIVASILKPAFMFKNLFADSMIGMTDDQKAAFDVVINNIQGDLKTIVDYTMENNVTGFGEPLGISTKVHTSTIKY